MGLYDGTCRGNDAGKLVDAVSSADVRWTVGELAQLIHRSVRYVRSVVDDAPQLRLVDTRGRRVRDFTVGLSR